MIILIDADAFIGLRNLEDAHHTHATKLMEKIYSKNVHYYTSWDVISETAAKLSYNISQQQCVSFLDFVQNGLFKILYPNNKRAKQAVEIRRNIASKNVSLTDCMNMALADEIGADCIFSFDKIYTKQKIPLLKDLV